MKLFSSFKVKCGLNYKNYTGGYMERITGKNLQIITECVLFAQQFLSLPNTIDYYFEECPSERFPSMNNAAESNVQSICFNKQWFLERTIEHRDDLQFFIFHELRHIHQLNSITIYDKTQKHKEDISTIESWRVGFNNYIRNTDAVTESLNIVQEIEIDANAYAICLVNLLHIDDDMELNFSLPQTAGDISFERSKQYYNIKSELKHFLDKWKQEKSSLQNKQMKNLPIKNKIKIGANDRCPCGSGKKFKRCCRGKGIYD